MSEVCFGPFCLAGANGPLLHAGRDVKLAPKTLAVLWMLVRNPGQVVTRRALLAAIWPTSIVSEDALSFQVQLLRQALNDDSRAPLYIATVHRVGFRFVAQVRATTRAPVKVATVEVAVTPEPATSLVGRTLELQHLLELLKNKPDERRQLVFLSGEAAIGKSALLDLFLDRATRRPAPPLIAYGQCTEQSGASEPYLPIFDALGRLCRAHDGASYVDLLKRLAPSWILQMPSLVADDEEDGLRQKLAGLTRERMLREMVDVLDVLGRERLLILVLEDLQWSDSATLDLLGMLARRHGEGGRLLLLGSYRPADAIIGNSRLQVLKQEMLARRQATEIALGYLSAEDVRTYLRRRLPGGDNDTGSISELVYRRSQGHPLFMVQMADDLERHGAAEFLGGKREALPESLRKLIDAQIGRLDSVEQQVLEEASVGGMEFTCAAIAAAAGRTTDVVEEHCRMLARHGQFIEECGTTTWPDGTASTRYRFRHVLYQEVLYRRSTDWQRRHRHLDLAIRLEMAYGEQATEVAEELARHFERGGDLSRALRCLRIAAVTAAGLDAYSEAVILLRRALTLVLQLGDKAERERQETPLQVALRGALAAEKGYVSPEAKNAHAKGPQKEPEAGQAA